MLWNANTKETTRLETNMKDPCFMAWAKAAPLLAIGSQKGNLFLYNSKTLKKIPILGKHSRDIICGAWNADNKLALASLDRTVNIILFYFVCINPFLLLLLMLLLLFIV